MLLIQQNLQATGAAISLTVDNAVSAQTAGTVAVTQTHALSVSTASTATTTAAPAATQVHALAVGSATSATTTSTPTIPGGATSLTVDAVASATSTSTITVTQTHSLLAEGGVSAGLMDAVLLTQGQPPPPVVLPIQLQGNAALGVDRYIIDGGNEEVYAQNMIIVATVSALAAAGALQ